MSEAAVYITEVNDMTGELDVSGLPNELGVYAIFSAEERMQYIGLSKDIQRSVAAHADSIGIQEAGALISTVRCLEMPGQTKEALKGTWERWIRDHMEVGGEIPAGNLPGDAPGADPRWRSRAGQSKPPLNLAGVRGIASPNEALDAVKKAVTKNPVVLFMKGTPAMPQCGFSARAVGILRESGVPYDTVNVLDGEANPWVRDAVKQYSNWPTIPQLFVRGELLGGTDIISEMHQSGQLLGKLKGAVSGVQGGAAPTPASETAAPAAAGNVALVNDPNRPVASLMSRTLNEKFQLYDLRIFDDSSQHEGDAGALEMGLTSESHFRVEVVAPEFGGLSPVQRQQKVFDALSEVMPRIHALSLVTKTPAEVA